MILAPFLYIKIFKHINAHNKNNSGLSERAKSVRKRRNLVNIKFNLIAWILEAFSILFSIISPNLDFIFLFVMNISPPLIYFAGIEENREAAEEYFKSRMRVFKRKNQIQDIRNKDELKEFRRSAQTGIL